MTPRTCIALLVVAAAVPSGARAHGDDYAVSVDIAGGVTFETFHEPLASYGEWVTVANYGPVWRPRVAVGWRPYYYGRWEWTNEGWLWVSDEPWGWAAYHYGRWAHDPYYGWIWVPGYEWAPAWVSWRTSGDVIGWAPLAPGLSVYVTTYPFVDFYWTFVPTVRFVSVPVYTVAYAPGHTRRWYHHTAPAPARPAPRGAVGRVAAAPVPAWGGPAPRLIAERTGRAPTPARIVASPAPSARAARPGEIPVYRPESRPAPQRGVGSGAAALDAGPRGSPAPGRGRAEGFAPSGAPEPRGAGGSAAQAGRAEGRGPAPIAPPRGDEQGQRGGVGRGAERAAPSWRSEPGPPPSAAPAPPRSGAGRGAERAAPSWQRAEPRSSGPAAPPPSRGGAVRGGGGSSGSGGGRDDRGAPPGRR